MSESVLVVEDDLVYRGLLGQALIDAGYDVRLAAGVTEAVLLARWKAPQLAVIDLRLPDGTGVDVVRKLTAVAPACRCVMLSGHATVPAAVEAMRAGAVDFLTKPIAGPDLVAALRDAMEPEDTATLDEMERAHILGVLQACGGNITEAARRLGLYRRTLQRKLQKLPPAR